MSTIITIPTELEQKMAKRAAERGKDMQQFALEALARAVETPSLRELFGEVREEIRASGLLEEQLDSKIESAVNEVRKQRRA